MIFEYNGKDYPDHIRQGNHAQYILPVAKKVCQGSYGIDIGANNPDWAFPNAKICDWTQPAPWNDAMKIPQYDDRYDFVFSSHCLEHIPDYYGALKEWIRVLKPGGTFFLYLPSVECEYWRPANNRKHVHIFYPDDIVYDLKSLDIESIFKSGVDLAYSYAIYGYKKIHTA
jgi:SAM-dependent methyltransferase